MYGIKSVFNKDGFYFEEERILGTWRDVWQIPEPQITKIERD